MDDSIMNSMRISIIVMFIALIWVSCGNNDSDTDMEEPDPEATGMVVWDHLQQENYQENWHTEQHILAQNRDDFWNGDVRFGFNVNRLFFF